MARKLLFSITKKDFEITYYSGTGAGGQHRNRHKNCVRLKHIDSGVIVTGANSRSLEQNKKNAFKRLVNHKKFKAWLKIRVARETISSSEFPSYDEVQKALTRRYPDDINEKLDDMMQDKYLKVEYL